jgi:acyl carrier protein
MGSGGEQIEDDTSFLEQDILDSTGVLELISFMEEQCGITVEDEEMVPENLDSLNAIEAFVRQKLAAAA